MEFDKFPYFHYYRNMEAGIADQTPRFADMFAAIGSEQRLRILRLLLSAHPDGLVVGEIQGELGMSAANLSHHLDKLRNEGLIEVTREGTFMRYRANTAVLQEMLEFLYAECCTRNKAIPVKVLFQACKTK
jgi:ArsR family transcriptional regulator, arsenate/arsenite/antimonite-responsive transcriptional repressor